MQQPTEKRQRLIIADPYITDQGGHSFIQADLIAHAALQRGMPCLVLGSLAARQDCSGIPYFHGALDNVSHLLFAASCNKSHWLRLPAQLWRTCASYQRAFFTDNPAQLRAQDVVYLQTFTAYDLLCIAYVLGRNHRRLRELNTKICFNFRFSYIATSPLLTRLNTLLYHLIFFFLRKCGPACIELMADSDVLAQDFERIQPWPVKIIPDALVANAAVFAGVASPAPAAGPLRISYIGSARWNKGFDVFVELVKELAAQDPRFAEYRFFAQGYIQPQVKRDTDAAMASLAELKTLQADHPHITIYENPLARDAYLNLLQNSDIVVLPYKKVSYRAATSNVLIEAIQYGTIPIVTRDTWLGHELGKRGFEDLCYDETDLRDVRRVFQYAVQNRAALLQKLAAFKAEWQTYHTAEALLDALPLAGTGK